MNQSAELRSALVFFATAQLFRERSLETGFENSLKILAALVLQRNTCASCLPRRPLRVRTLQEKAERLMAATCQLFEELMATYHSLGIAGKVAGKSYNIQWAFRKLWKK